MEPVGRTVEPAGATGNDAEALSRRLTIKAPAKPPNKAATKTTTTAPATMAEVTPAPSPPRPPRSGEATLGESPADSSGTGCEPVQGQLEVSACSGSTGGGG